LWVVGLDVGGVLLRPALQVTELLTDEVVGWLRQQLGQPQAKRRELGELERRLRGKEMTKQEVVKQVEEWLGGGEDDIIEVV
jgi:hypothetical protein